MAVMCWHLWESRNDSIYGSAQLHPIHVANKIKVYVDNIIQFCYKPSAASRRESQSALKLTPPPCGQVCINVDAAIFSLIIRWDGVLFAETMPVLFCSPATKTSQVSPPLNWLKQLQPVKLCRSQKTRASER
jgi:hypothetical protein